jgi:uncharacterized protein (TIGR00255 family)
VHLPEVVCFEAPDKDSVRVWPLLQKAVTAALGGLSAMKRREGRAMEKDLLVRVRVLHALVKQIKKLAPSVASEYRQAMEARLREAGFDISKADPQILKEVALFAERADIVEETVRLDSHFGQMRGLIGSASPSGRALDFLCQEMLREINTIGSKANSGAITELVVQFKAGLETVREQVQNVE